MDEYKYKKESTIILACILIILISYFLYWIMKSMNKYITKYMKKSIIKDNEMFSNRTSSNGSKREMMKKIYKSDEILDPDEIIMNNPNADDCDDPDGNCGTDPDDTILMNKKKYNTNEYIIKYKKNDDVCDFYNNYCNNI